jgi:uncharacterized protein (DUF2147 family)
MWFRAFAGTTTPSDLTSFASPFMTTLFVVAVRVILAFNVLVQGATAGAGTADDITGEWQTGNGDAVVKVFEKNGMYYGKVISLSQPLDKHGQPKRDRKNTNPELRNRPQLGMLVLYGLKFNAKQNCWDKGKVYVPSLGKEANVIVTLETNDTLRIRGFLGNEKLGHTQLWTRKKN